MHDSGAERALAADIAHELGVQFADLADTTLTSIGALLDDGLVPTNPLDVWGTGADTRKLFDACLQAMTDDPGVGVTALAVDLVTEFDGDTAYADAAVDVWRRTDAPLAVLTSVSSAIDDPTAKRLRHNGIPVLEGTRSGIAALGHLVRWPLPVDGSEAPVQPNRGHRWRARLADGVPGLELLADYGVPVVDSRTAGSLDELLAAAEAVGYPVALKTVGALHKSDVGGVALGLADAASLGLAYTAMARSLGPQVTVQPMVDRGVEISVGVVRDEGFGPLVVVAAGGTLVELLADRVVAYPPVTHARALRLLHGLRIGAFLGGWRGGPAADIDALADVIVCFSDLAAELGDVLDAAEANPVIASPHGVVAVDALVLTRSLTARSR